jgi:hypothetical protein
MPITNDYYDFNVSEHFFSAIINGDYSGLNDEEENLLNRFLSFANTVDNPSWQIDDIETQDSHFIDCDVTGLFSNCYNVKLHFFNPEIVNYPHLQSV